MYLQRCGAIQHTSGARMDLELGAASLQGSVNSFGLLWSLFQTVASPTNYLVNWLLPPEFTTDLQNQLNGNYQVQLTNRLSSICGDAYTVTDIPNTNWPVDKNYPDVLKWQPTEVCRKGRLSKLHSRYIRHAAAQWRMGHSPI